MNGNEEIIIAYDKTLMRPGCALLQAIFGGDLGIAGQFEVEDWLLAPTPDLRPYRIQRYQISQIIEMTRKARKKNKKGNKNGEKKASRKSGANR